MVRIPAEERVYEEACHCEDPGEVAAAAAAAATQDALAKVAKAQEEKKAEEVPVLIEET